jgi:hypothetical protein
MQRDWIAGLTNVLLIRDPAQVVASYLRTRETVSAEDIGMPQQAQLYAWLCERGEAPPVIDAGEFLQDPEGQLRALCSVLGIDFSPRMLRWPAGPRASDGSVSRRASALKTAEAPVDADARAWLPNAAISISRCTRSACGRISWAWPRCKTRSRAR